MSRLKQRGGYIIAYVVVLLLLAGVLVAGALVTAMRGFQAQQLAVARAQALYQAEGRVEAYLAGIVGQEVNDIEAALTAAGVTVRASTEDGSTRIAELPMTATVTFSYTDARIGGVTGFVTNVLYSGKTLDVTAHVTAKVALGAPGGTVDSRPAYSIIDISYETTDHPES